MSKAHEIVKTGMSLAGFFRRFPSDAEAEAWFVRHRWPDGIVCAHCGSAAVSVVGSRRPQPYRCRSCRRHFSHMTDTPMHASKLGAQTWLLAIFQIVSNPKGRSSVQLAADLGICQKSARRLAHRIRSALAEGSLAGFEGPVEADETYIGGKARNMHARKRSLCASGPADKAPVIAVRDRASGQVAATPVHEVTAATATAMVQATANAGAAVFTDGHKVGDPLAEMGLHHAAVMHTVGDYVRGEVSTNGVENCWSCLKRACIGPHHYMSDDHLHRHIEQHSFRYNRLDRHVSDRTANAARATNGRRLPWEQLTSPAPAA